MTHHKRSLKCAFIIFTFILLWSYSCRRNSSNNEEDPSPVAGTEDGYYLAKKYCGSCHKFVPAAMLDKITWQDKVLPGMAPNVGIGVFGETDYINNPDAKPGTLPFQSWVQIVNYYIENAPEKLTPATPPAEVIKDWSIFELKKPIRKIYPFSRTMLVSFDTATNTIFTSDGNTNFLYRWNSHLQLVDSAYVSSAAVSAQFFNNKKGFPEAVFSTLGTMVAKDISEGYLFQYNISKKLSAPKDTLAKNLPRPVHAVAADFNNDGRTDWVICGFGHMQGGLYWLEQLPDGKYKKNTIIEIPGAIHAVPGDFNHDGWQDLMVLFAHDDESIGLFTNDHKGSFTSSRLLTLPPVYGSSSFQLADFNTDGLPDILYTCGDNADLSQILKPFHGFYIFINKGNFKYEQSYFYPINGCTKAIAADFDNDGDLDIATIAFFADFKNNQGEKFLYFEQDKPMHFIPHSPPIDSSGRWICMDAADIDKDGDIDIILGNFAKGFLQTKDYTSAWDNTTPFIILENKTIQNILPGKSAFSPK